MEPAARKRLVARANRPHHVPASDAQQRLWFVDQLEHTSTEYNLPEAIWITGELDVDSLKRALNTIVERHEVLRTRFYQVDNEVVQFVEPEITVPLECEDISAHGIDTVRAAIRKEWNERFDLARGPLIRTRLLKLGEREYVFIRTVHHIVFDGWSVGVFNRELWKLYDAYADGRDNPLPPLPLQCADFALWQREYLSEARLAAGLAYWTIALKGIPERLDLPTDRVRPAVQTFDAEIHRAVLPRERLDAVRQFSRARHVTPYMTLLAAFGVVVSRHTGSDDMVVGSPIANRPASVLDDLIGFFANTVVMRVRPKRGMSFGQLLVDVRQKVIAAHEHQDVPFDRLVRELSPQRSVSSSPLVQVVFALQNAPWAPLRLQNLEIERIESDQVKLRTELSVHAYERDDQLEVQWHYSTALFDRWRIEELARQYEHVLQQVIEFPDRPLEQLTILGDEARRYILRTWNDTARDINRDVCVHQLFEARAISAPDAPAVVANGQGLTYAQLNERANQLARALHLAGVRPEALVAVCIDRSVDVAVALLAVLKAGGAYVPLDPRYPSERLRYMLEDSQAAFIVTNGRVRALLPETGARVLCLDDDRNTIGQYSTSSADSDVSPRNVAYTIYTSGSTGSPKGVQVEHRGLSHYVQAMDAALPDVFTRRCLHTASLAFSSSVRQMFVPLCAGGTVVLAPDEVVRDSAALLEHIISEDIETIDLVPSAWRSAVACLKDAGSDLQSRLDQSRLKTILFASEPLTTESLRAWQSMMRSKVRFINMYGQTETTGIVTTHVILDRDVTALGTVPVGRPIANTSAYVLDDCLEPVPVGAAGDLYIEGPGVARGYLHESGFTAARFAASPFGVHGARLYSTGDRARYSRHGVIELLGRTDDQAKIHGCRVHCGEIEAALRAQAGVRDAAVVANSIGSGEARLIAYVVPSRPDVDAAALRGVLKASLPDYMVPSVIAPLDALPMTASGKVDRRQLPAVDVSVPASQRREPQTPEEHLLCEQFAELLGVASVGVDDNFFALGGYSLLVTRLVNRLRSTLGVNISINTLFDAPTPSELARHLRQLRASSPATSPTCSTDPPTINNSRPPTTWPRDMVEDLLADLWERLLRIRRVGVYDDFFELGGTVADCELMITGIEYLFGTRLPLDVFKGSVTVERLTGILTAHFPTPEILEIQAGDPCVKLPLFYLHGELGGGGLYVRELARGLGKDQPVYVLQQHGLNGQPIPTSIEAMADDHVRRLREFWPHGPYCLGGHCNGAAIAFEMARLLVEQNQKVASVLLVEPPLGDRYDRPTRPAQQLPLLPPEQMRLFHVRASWMVSQYHVVMQHYRPKRYPGKVDLFWARYREAQPDPRAVFEQLAAEVSLHIVPGTHVTALGRHVRKLARAMQDCLPRAQQAAAGGHRKHDGVGVG